MILFFLILCYNANLHVTDIVFFNAIMFPFCYCCLNCVMLIFCDGSAGSVLVLGVFWCWPCLGSAGRGDVCVLASAFCAAAVPFFSHVDMWESYFLLYQFSVILFALGFLFFFFFLSHAIISLFSRD